MRKIINDPEAFVDQMLEGIMLTHPDRLRPVGNDLRAVARAQEPRPRTVGIVTGGGSGHLPLFLGYVGAGLCSAAAIGNVFSSPSPQQVLAATQAADGGAGVVYLYGNYGGDVLNVELAAGCTVAVLVNGLGATPLEELYLLYRYVHHALAGAGIEIAYRRVGELATSLEMAGASISLLTLDDELAELLGAPASSPFFEQPAREERS